MASITLKDYLISLSTKGSISDSDLLPLLDSGADNALKKITKGTLVNLSDIDGFTEFSSSIEGDLFALSFASSSNVETSLQQQIDINNLGAYTQSLKSAIIVDGADVQIIGELRADKFYVNYITSSVSLLTGSNEFGDTLADRHTFIGDIYINGDGPIGFAQLNSFSGSQLSVNSGVSAVTGAFSTELGELQIQNVSQNLINDGILAVSGAIVTELSGIQSNISSFDNVFGGVSAVTGAFATELGQLQTQNTSQGGVNSGVSAVTGAFATELGDIQTILSGHRNEISGLEAFTASLDSTYATDAQVAAAVAGLNTQTGSQNSINSGISAVTGAFTTELGELQNNVTDFSNVLSGVAAVSGAIVTELSGIQNNITSFNNVFSGVSAVTGAFTTELGDIQTILSGHRGEISGLEAFTASLDSTYATDAQVADAVAGLNTQTGSQNSINSGISAVTGAFTTELSGIQTQLTNRRDELNGLEAYTASLKSAGIVSSSTQIENYNLFAVTSSENTFYDNLNVFGNLTINTGSAVNTYNGLTIGGSDPSLAFKTNSPAGWEWIEFHNNSGTNNFSIGVNQTQPQFVIKAGAGMDSPDVSVNTSGDLTVHNGNLKINTAGKGIDFSATSDGSGTTTSELLDDYEYGTFTPILSDAVTGGNTATGTFYGTYTKIGRQVIIGIGLNDITTSGMTAGNVVYIQGLPFTCGASQVSPGVCNFYNVDIGDNNAIAWLNSAVSSTALRVLKQSPTTNSGLIVSDITSTTAEITLSITYYT